MKAKSYQKYWVFTKALWSTFITSVHVLVLALFRRLSRARVDRITKAWTSTVLRSFKVTWRVIHPERGALEKDQAYIIMSNHASLLDIPLVYKAFPGASIRMLAKKELFKVPVWAHAMRASEFISIDRHDRKQAVLDLKRAEEKLRSGIVVWVAPEGTRTRNGELLPFKKGGFMLAKKTNATIIPLAIKGAFDILPPKSTDLELNTEVDLIIGEPVKMEDYANINEAMSAVKDMIAELLET